MACHTGSCTAVQANASQEEATAVFARLDELLLPRTYLVGESVSVADVVLAVSLSQRYAAFFTDAARAQYINVTRWYVTVTHQELYKTVLSGAAKAAAAAPVAAAAAVAGDEEFAAPVEKKKNPLDLLPPSNFNLEDWKRFYSNNDTVPTAVDYFWKNFDREGFSIWWINYKYNDELAKIFMTCNLVTGLFARMDHLRKYAFGSFLIFGEDDKNEISGAMVFRGQDLPPEVKAIGDYDSYTWTRMNLDDAKERELFNAYLAWEGDFGGKVVNQGKTYK